MEILFQNIIDLSIMGTILTLVILVLKALFRGRLSAFWHYTIWFLLILRLAMPIAPQNGFSIYNLSKPITSAVQQKTGNSSEVPDIIPQTTFNETLIEHSAKEMVLQKTSSVGLNGLSIMDLMGIVWLIGALSMAMVILISNIRFYGRMRYCIPCKDPQILKELAACHALASVKRTIPLCLSENARVPVLLGIFKPRLIISAQIMNKLSDEEQRHIFLHELIHYKRKDILTNWVTAILKCIYWFNPFILYAFHKMSEDCELSCDESVLKRLAPSEYRSYGKTIINLAGMNCRPVVLASASGLITRQSGVKRRIIMISKYKRKTALGTAAALILTLLVGCAGLTNANTKPEEDLIEPAPTPTTVTQQPNTKEDEKSEQLIELENQIKTLEDANELEMKKREQKNVEMYLDKLKDKTFTDTYGDGYTWYTAAEELGMIGKTAIPGLIAKLDTEDDYERALVLYALLLATQHESVKFFTLGEYIDVNLDFNPDSHPAMVEKAKAWWEKYKDHFIVD
jgi:bla regulator protein BlaR1